MASRARTSKSSSGREIGKAIEGARVGAVKMTLGRSLPHGVRTVGVAHSLLRGTPRHVHTIPLSALHALPERLAIGSRYFVLLLAADFESSSLELDRLSRRVLQAG